MNPATDPMFAIPLAWDAHDLAQQNRQRASAHRAKSVYLRTLVVYAVKYYLECMGIAAQYGDDISHEALLQLSQTTTVQIPDLGSLECVPVLPETSSVTILPEAWSDRIAYIAVQLDHTLRTATIIGYVETAAAAPIALEKFKQNHLEDLLTYLDRLQQSQVQKQAISQLPIKLSQWFHNEFHQGWENIQVLFPETHLAYRHRPLSSAMGQKVFDLKRAEEQVELSLGLTPIDTAELKVCVGVYPTRDHAHLPNDLQIAIINELGEAVMQTQAKSTENIQLEFSGEPGEQFSVRLTLGDVSVTEAFII